METTGHINQVGSDSQAFMITFQTLFINELAGTYDAKRQVVKVLQKMAGVSSCDDLKSGLICQLEEAKSHIKKIEQIFDCFDRKAKAKPNQAATGLLAEVDEIVADYQSSPVINAALIAVAQKIEHYEIAAFGCLHEWAGLLKNEEAANLLLEILEEVKAANDALTELARTNSNQEALDEFGDNDDAE